MKKHKPKLLLAGVMAFAISSSSCGLLGGLGGLLGDAAGGLGDLLGGGDDMGLTGNPDGSSLSLTSQNKGKIEVRPSNKLITHEGSKLYGSY